MKNTIPTNTQAAFIRRHHADLLRLRRDLSAALSEVEQREYELLSQDDAEQDGAALDFLNHRRAALLRLDDGLEGLTAT